ncbi:hypothetical protein JK635_02175 [Neobacillus sp. YIM B02564]|uniref:Uncharacterized protein n=1 Tax=Neobacillus paridis TaxID=2803862 RepID=A0ABS1TIA8_9BACI|nr:hypothetical protein [Neobacillus paridis]MBL4951046.1 hypothetical protein [Neobacillus paridis]
MRVLVSGVIYDSTKTPIVIEFDVNERLLFNGMKKFVSAPPEYVEERRNELMDKPLEKLQKDYMRELLQTQMSKTEEIE